jgi:hypothetical protein
VRPCVIYVSGVIVFFVIFPELIFAMPSIASREMDALVTPFGPCDVSILSYFYIILYYYFYSIT